MNEQVSKFLEEQKQKKEKEIKQKRINHLASLGLYDFEKCSKVYAQNQKMDKQELDLYGYRYKDDNGYFKIDGPKYAIQVTDEEYAEICKYCPPQKDAGNFDKDKDDEENKLFKFGEALSVIAYLSAAIIIISVIVLLAIDTDNWMIALGMLFVCIVCVLSALCNSYLLKVIAKISRKIK